jgi:MIP family channel proteins
MNENLKQTLAEMIGTFTLVFIGAGAGALAGPSDNGTGVLGVALAHGLALVTCIYAWGHISGCHINPAVTFGLAITGKISPVKAVLYWLGQFVGAFGAAYLLLWLLGPESTLGQTKGTLTDTNAAKTIVVEGVLTFFLVIAVFGSGVTGRNGNALGLAIGLILTMDILMGASLTGASMNPARTFGPALAMGDMSYMWMYLVGPLAGGGLAALVYNTLFIDKNEVL